MVLDTGLKDNYNMKGLWLAMFITQYMTQLCYKVIANIHLKESNMQGKT